MLKSISDRVSSARGAVGWASENDHDFCTLKRRIILQQSQEDVQRVIKVEIMEGELCEILEVEEGWEKGNVVQEEGFDRGRERLEWIEAGVPKGRGTPKG